MRIVMLISALNTGGAERVAATLCNAWVDRGDDVTLIPTYSGGGRPFYPISDSVELIYLANRVAGGGRTPVGYARRVRKLRNLIAAKQPDVVVSFLTNVNVMAVLALAGSGIPLIVCERHDPGGRAGPRGWLLASQALYRYADMLAMQTDAAARAAGRLYPSVRRVATIPNPVPAQISDGPSAKGGTERRILLSVGRLTYGKRVDLAIDAFGGLAGRYPEWDFHILGDGEMRTSLEKLIERSGLSGRVFLRGASAQVWNEMVSADAFVMTSQHEGFPNALLEAMGVGLPCVVFDCPSGPREITESGSCALLTPLNDTQALSANLESVMSDDAFRRSLGEQARKSVAARYSLTAVLQKWDALFAAVRG